MSRQGKISSLKRDFNDSSIKTMQSELSKQGMTRVPGTGVFKFPHKELTGKYRTGLDPDASYIKRIEDDLERSIEVDRVNALRKKLANALGLEESELGPYSKYWNHSLATPDSENRYVRAMKLLDGDNYFDLTNPLQELAYSWLRVHPTIASSYEAWQRGEYAADSQYYVNDNDVESKVLYNKKQLINKAIVKFELMSPDRKRKIARVMGLPVTADTKEEIIYNLVDTQLKETEFKDGAFRGLSPVQIFTKFADMKEGLLHIKDLIKQAITHSIYRVGPNDKVFEGQSEVAKSEDDLVAYLANEDNQEDLIILEQKLKSKKLAAV